MHDLCRAATKRQPAVPQVALADGQRILVRTWPRFASEKLGSREVWGAAPRVPGLRALQRARQPEVADLDLPAEQQQVAGLDVPVHDPLEVSVRRAVLPFVQVVQSLRSLG